MVLPFISTSCDPFYPRIVRYSMFDYFNPRKTKLCPTIRDSKLALEREKERAGRLFVMPF